MIILMMKIIMPTTKTTLAAQAAVPDSAPNPRAAAIRAMIRKIMPHPNMIYSSLTLGRRPCGCATVIKKLGLAKGIIANLATGLVHGLPVFLGTAGEVSGKPGDRDLFENTIGGLQCFLINIHACYC